jgi:AcrR family transcriptional regulator
MRQGYDPRMSAVIDQPRNARSRRTAEALLSAARGLLETRGFEAMTMAAVADRAGVTRRAVYLRFGSRAALLAALFEHIKETEGFAESVAPVWAAPDAVTALGEWAAHIARFTPRILAVAQTMERVRRDDPDAAAHRALVTRGRHRDCRRLMAWLADEGRLADGWTVDDAADLLLALISVQVVETLIVDRRWSRRRLEAHLATLLHATFVAPSGP